MVFGTRVGFSAELRFIRYRGLHTRTAVARARLPLRQLGFLANAVNRI